MKVRFYLQSKTEKSTKNVAYLMSTLNKEVVANTNSNLELQIAAENMVTLKFFGLEPELISVLAQLETGEVIEIFTVEDFLAQFGFKIKR